MTYLAEKWNMGRIVPIVVLENENRVELLAEALYAGGISSMEITLRTPAALGAIERIAGSTPKLLVGAGTVLNEEMARNAVSCGARFIVSPGLSRDVVSWCQGHEIPVFPGVSTPSEIMAALEMGLDCMKFFPAEQSGGVELLKALASPFAGVHFMPTGGINPENLLDYLRLPNVTACGGSWFCSQQMIREGAFEQITALCRQAVALSEALRT